jgi:hypothetical protein
MAINRWNTMQNEGNAKTRMFNLKLLFICVCVFNVIILISCTSPTQITPTVTPTLAPTETPTPTVVWFPPTPTKTPVVKEEPTATLELRPGVGDIIFEDNFSNDSSNWLIGQNANGTTAIGVNEITLAIIQPRAYLSSIRSDLTFSDFYVEITASPSLCVGLDEYGLLFRVRSSEDFYRFSLSCDGQVRLDRVVGGTAGSPQPWLISASVPRGAPSSSRLGVWARESDLRFFVNDEYQFAVIDTYHDIGNIGVFARSAGENAVTVSFSELKVYQIGQ